MRIKSRGEHGYEPKNARVLLSDSGEFIDPACLLGWVKRACLFQHPGGAFMTTDRYGGGYIEHCSGGLGRRGGGRPGDHRRWQQPCRIRTNGDRMQQAGELA
jgi:hypothetical protein